MADGYAGLSRQYAETARKRFHASAQSTDFVFMMVRYAGKDVGLAKVSKRTGEIEAMINMRREKTPSPDDSRRPGMERRDPIRDEGIC